MPRPRGRGRGKGRGAKSPAKGDATPVESTEEVADTSQTDTMEAVEDGSEASQENLDSKQVTDVDEDQVAKPESDQQTEGDQMPVPQTDQSSNSLLQSQQAEAVQLVHESPQQYESPVKAEETTLPIQQAQQTPSAVAQSVPDVEAAQMSQAQQVLEGSEQLSAGTMAVEESQETAATTVPKETPSQMADTAEDQELDDYSKLTSRGIDAEVASEICNMIQAGTIASNELTAEAYACLKEFPKDQINNAIKEFSETDLSEIKNKGDHLVTILKVWQEDKTAHVGTSSGPNEAKIKAILERTGFNHEVTSGQRHYGPPANWEGDAPTHQSEVFIGKVPRDVYEDELVPLCEECGNLYEMRIMIDPNTGFNRGFAFVRFADKESARSALEKLNDYEIRPGKKIKVNVSNPNMRLFVGNIPKTKSKEEIMEEFSKLTENLKDVIVYSAPDDVDTQRKNRGFCFLHYGSHSDAAEAKKKLGRHNTRVFDSDIFVDWADPIDDNDESVMAEVKILYVRNLSSDVTEEMVKEKFGSYGALEKVKRLKDYAFVHFEEREHALKAMEALNGFTDLGKCAIEVTLARPVSEKARQKREQRKMEHQAQRWGRVSVRARGRGWGGAPYGSWGPQYGGWGANYAGWGDYGYGRQMQNYGWGYGGHWGYGGQRPPVGGFRGRPQGFWPRGGRGYGPGARGFGNQQPRGVGAFGRGGRGLGGAGSGFGGGGFGARGGMKRKADDAANGAGDAKRDRRLEAGGQEAAAEQPRQDQDWTSDDVGASW